EDALDVDRKEREVAPERLHVELLVEVDVGLPDLHEPPVRREQPEALAQRLSGKRIQHHIDTASPGHGADLLDEGERARIEGMCHALREEVLAALGGSSGGEDLRSHVAGDLDGGHAPSARTAVNEHALALL